MVREVQKEQSVWSLLGDCAVLADYKIPTIRRNVLFNYGHDPKDIANGGEAGIFCDTE
jgi:hypothetical protein